MIQAKPNPYVALLNTRLTAVLATGDEMSLAEFVNNELIAPKNKRIHELNSDLQHLQAEIARLGKVLDRHNAGEWHKGKESAIDCAVRLLSPVPDTTPQRDRP